MNLTAVDKPSGCSTHRTSQHELGWAEMLAATLGKPLFPIHRLDQDTSGLLVVALDRESANQARETLEDRASIEKEYIFLTEGRNSQSQIDVCTAIERTGASWSVRQGETALTRFTKLEDRGRFHLWQARPMTGRTHQVRLHAAHLGLSVFGDPLYSGRAEGWMALWSRRLRIGGSEFVSSVEPWWLRENPTSQEAALLFAAIERRQRWLSSLICLGLPTPEAIRWCGAHDGLSLTVDELNSVIHLSETPATRGQDLGLSPELELAVQRFLSLRGKPWYRQSRRKRGRPGLLSETVSTSLPPPPVEWTLTEADLHFQMRRDRGLSPGLFADQRENRAWLKRSCRGLQVLNLFCYTGGFSVAALAGGAERVVSIDAQASLRDWINLNLALNSLDSDAVSCRHEFHTIDARRYLDIAHKKGARFHRIIADPPSFGRGPKGEVFRVGSDLRSLLRQILNCLDPLDGQALLSINSHEWTQRDLLLLVEAELQSLNLTGWTVGPGFFAPDHRLDGRPGSMKAVLVSTSTVSTG